MRQAEKSLRRKLLAGVVVRDPRGVGKARGGARPFQHLRFLVGDRALGLAVAAADKTPPTKACKRNES